MTGNVIYCWLQRRVILLQYIILNVSQKYFVVIVKTQSCHTYENKILFYKILFTKL